MVRDKRKKQIGINVFPLKPGQNGGVENLVVEMVKALASTYAGIELTLFTSQANDWLFSDLPDNCISVALDIPQSSYKDYGRRFRKEIEKRPLDFIHYPLTTIFPLDLKLPCLLSMMDIQHEYYPEFFLEEEWQLRDNTYRASADKAQRIIAISEFTKRSIVERYDVAEKRIDVVYPWCEEQLYEPIPEEDTKGLEHFSLPQNYLLYPAGTWPHKNHQRLLEALLNLRAKGVILPLVLTGVAESLDGPISQFIQENGLSDQIYQLGYVDRKWMRLLLKAARFLIFPSLFEGFGLPVLEAMALGTPVACSENTSLPELGGTAVRYFDGQDVHSIQKAIIELWEDSQQRILLGVLGRRQAWKFHRDIGVKSLMDSYERMYSEIRGGYLASGEKE